MGSTVTHYQMLRDAQSIQDSEAILMCHAIGVELYRKGCRPKWTDVRRNYYIVDAEHPIWENLLVRGLAEKHTLSSGHAYTVSTAGQQALRLWYEARRMAVLFSGAKWRGCLGLYLEK